MRAGSLLLRPTPPPLTLGIAVAASLVAAETLVVYPLKRFTPVPSLGVIYLIGILVVVTGWGLRLGLATAVASVLAFNFFHIPPTGTFTVESQDMVRATVFLIVALVTSFLADRSRSRAAESDLAADMARILLYTDDPRSAVPAVAQRLAQALKLPSATIELETVPADERHAPFPLRANGIPIGTLLVPAGLPKRARRRLHERVAPSLESLLYAAHERTAMLNSLEASHEKLRLLAGEQAALRRVATLVARGVPPSEILDAVTKELRRLLGADTTCLLRYEPDGMAAYVSTTVRGLTAEQLRWPFEGDNVIALVWNTGRPARIDNQETATGRPAAMARELGIRSSVGVPILIGGRLWGVAEVASTGPEPLPSDTEARIANFTDLAAIGIANADSRNALVASRARIVAAADEARRRIERDLHDGAQQQLVALALESRMAAAAPAELDELKGQLSRVATSLVEILDNLRETSRGIHPAILSKGGLGPALRTLARRSAVLVKLDMHNDRQLPEQVEVAAYYVVSESLTNAAKHACASVVHVDVGTDDGVLQLSIRDDGVGGADPGRGSGLIGLKDRVEALGGQMDFTSPAGIGTSLMVEIPIEGA
ncbi:DUF4118 domain-containing protein [Dactylosporangium sp. NPDC048998]|uniref:GAF domain-containing sensor histidine kinase n=1 Tax=Dactylosporangium sp. NPDC048998 TaxID=3363976 RepID=UPI0037215723